MKLQPLRSKLRPPYQVMVARAPQGETRIRVYRDAYHYAMRHCIDRSKYMPHRGANERG